MYYRYLSIYLLDTSFKLNNVKINKNKKNQRTQTNNKIND